MNKRIFPSIRGIKLAVLALTALVLTVFFIACKNPTTSKPDPGEELKRIEDAMLRVTAPVAGNKPDTNVEGVRSEQFKVVEVQWKKGSVNVSTDDEYETQTKYSVSIKLEAVNAEEYCFDHQFTATINGASVTVSDRTDRSVTVTRSNFQTAGIGESVISSAEIDIKRPVSGENPDTNTTAKTGSNFTAWNVAWAKVDDASWNAETDTFDDNSEYTATITLIAVTGTTPYVFISKDDGFTATITSGGSSRDAEEITRAADNTSVTIQGTFAIGSLPITNAEFTVQTPVVGAVPNVSGTSQQFSSTVQWDPALAAEKFDADTAYKVSIILTANENYYFSDDFEASINKSNETTLIKTSSTNVTVSLSFDKTGKFQITDAELSLVAPSSRKSPEVSGGTTGFTRVLTWEPALLKDGNTEYFNAATDYTVTVKLSAEAKYEFADAGNATTVRFNETSVNDAVKSSNEITFSHIFGKTAQAELSIMLGNPAYSSELATGAALSPMPDEETVTFDVTLSGFMTKADAEAATPVITDAHITGEGSIINTPAPLPATGSAEQGFSKKTTVTVRAGSFTAFTAGTVTAFRASYTTGKPEYAPSAAEPEALVQVRNGTADLPIPVGQKNIALFQKYANEANGSDKHYKMVEHVLLDDPASGGSNWTMVGESDICQFSGSFDGDGYTIANLAISKTLDYTGMFRYVDGGTIKNLGVSGSVTSSGQFTGGLVGRLGNGTVENSFFYGNVTGRIFVGGLIGYGITATVKDSYMAGNVLGADSGVIGTTVNTSVGGIAAYPAGAHLTLQRVFFSGYDKNTRGSVKGTSEVGGIIGGTNSGTDITASYLTALNIDVSSIASGNKHNSIAGRVALNGTTITVTDAFESRNTNVILNPDQESPDGTSLGLKGNQNVSSNTDPNQRIVRIADGSDGKDWWTTNMGIEYAATRDAAGWHWNQDKEHPVLGRPLPDYWEQYLPALQK